MVIYHWKSDALRDWLDGDIIILASSAQKAREKLVQHAEEGGFSELYTQALARDVAGDNYDIKEVYLIHGSS